MKRKEVDDVLGGPDAWANVDKTDGTLCLLSPAFPLFFFFRERKPDIEVIFVID